MTDEAPVPYLSSDALHPVPHGFFGREGGASAGTFASNNMSLAVGDDAGTVERNRVGACRQLGFLRQRLVLLQQVHSSRVVALTEAPDPAIAIAADGVVTANRDLVLGILTADCTPILLADHEAGVIGAVHAGWKGAVNGIVRSAVDAMVGLGAAPANIRAAIGPTISAASYEVGPDFVAELLRLHPGAGARVSRPAGGREHFDLPGFVADRLRDCGVATVDDLGICTYAAPERYFSHRYATHHGTVTGRQVALIGLS